MYDNNKSSTRVATETLLVHNESLTKLDPRCDGGGAFETVTDQIIESDWLILPELHVTF